MIFARIVLAAAALLSFCAPAIGSDWTKKTVLTFSTPVEIPGGKILPAGEYVFKLADSLTNRNIVQIFNAEENDVYATILAIPHYRRDATTETVVLFDERPIGRPQAIHAWFYPGDMYGQEFVYPKERALELARATHVPVLAGEVRPNETVAELEKTPVVEVTPESKEIALADLPAPRTGATEATLPESLTALPATASPLPLIGLVGISALALAAVIRTGRQIKP